jgi:hypothetical protein
VRARNPSPLGHLPYPASAYCADPLLRRPTTSCDRSVATNRKRSSPTPAAQRGPKHEDAATAVLAAAPSSEIRRPFTVLIMPVGALLLRTGFALIMELFGEENSDG